MRTCLSIALLCLLACGGCGKKEKSTEELLSDLKGHSLRERIIAVRLLSDRKKDTTRIMPALIEALKDKDDDVRRSAALGLASYGDQAKNAIPALKALEEDRDPRVRISARQAVVRIDPNAVATHTQKSSAGQ